MKSSRLLDLLAFLAIVTLVDAEEPVVRVLTDVTYLPAGRTEKLDLYLPATATPGMACPAVVWIHGGGGTSGRKSEERAKEICTTLARHGYVAASVDYKLGENAWPTSLLDCKNAIRFLRTRAADYSIDPDRIAVAGGSAGGHLACMSAFTATENVLEPAAPYPEVSDRVRCVIDMYGTTDISRHMQATPLKILIASSYLARETKDADERAVQNSSIFAHVTKNSPPVLILHGRADKSVDYHLSEHLAAVLKRNQVKHEIYLLDGVGHSFSWEKSRKNALPIDVRTIALAFLQANLK